MGLTIPNMPLHVHVCFIFIAIAGVIVNIRPTVGDHVVIGPHCRVVAVAVVTKNAVVAVDKQSDLAIVTVFGIEDCLELRPNVGPDFFLKEKGGKRKLS